MDKQGCETMPTVRSWHLVLTSTVVLFVVCLMVPWLGAMGRLVFLLLFSFFCSMPLCSFSKWSARGGF